MRSSRVSTAQAEGVTYAEYADYPGSNIAPPLAIRRAGKRRSLGDFRVIVEDTGTILFYPGEYERLLTALRGGEVAEVVFTEDEDMANGGNPALCQRVERTCQNCGRGLAHDEPCPDPSPTADLPGKGPLSW